MEKGKPRSKGKVKETGPREPRAYPRDGRGREPRAHPTTSSVLTEHPTFSFKHTDHRFDGDWGFRKEEHSHEVLGLLCDMGALTWGEIWQQRADGHKKHHPHAWGRFCYAARRRLEELHLDEVIPDELFRFRCGSKGRLWGFIRESTFYIIWWDPKHKVYPTEPKNT